MVGNHNLIFKKVLPLNMTLQSLKRIAIVTQWWKTFVISFLEKGVIQRCPKQILRKKVQRMKKVKC